MASVVELLRQVASGHVGVDQRLIQSILDQPDAPHARVTGRAREAVGDPEGALTAYAVVTQRSRFWAQATYLQGLIFVEKGRYKEGENLFCKVADPNRQSNTTPVFADAKFFVVRDLARLALGRVAHETGRFDDARYYYYLVPKDSDRLAEALYEAATTRYERKDYQDARDLLDELLHLVCHFLPHTRGDCLPVDDAGAHGVDATR